MRKSRIYNEVNMTRLLAVGFLLAASSAVSFGQVAEFGVGGGVSRLNGKDIGSGYSLDDGWRLIFRLTLNNWTFFGHEFGYAYNRTELLLGNQSFGGMAFHQGFYHFLAYATPEGSRIRPFASGGGHFSNFVPPGASATQGQGDNKFGVNYGGGVKVRVSEKFLVRLDFKQYLTGKPFDLPGADGNLRQNEISAGFSFVL
jgi:opacity protein-like surface antigen